VALSYTWGDTAEDLAMWPWPATTSDATSVTNKLGYRYLWVDSHCIDQDDNEEKACPVSKMAPIYEYADLVIVAAAGSGASYGLPGAGSKARKRQLSVIISGDSTESSEYLISAGPDPRNEIFSSFYWQRGWTYQEAILGRRRLAFTDHQAYWECRCMAAHESIEYQLDAVHEVNGSSRVMAKFLRGGVFNGPEFSAGSTVNTSKKEGDLILSEDMDRKVHYGFEVAQNSSLRSRLRGLAEHIREFTGR
jgi:hypothetical protein